MSDTRLGIHVSFLSQGFERLNAEFRELSNSVRGFEQLGRQLTFGLTLPIAMFARSLIETGREFSAHMNAIRGAIETGSGAVANMGAVQERIMALSKEWGKTPTELAAGMERLAHAYGETFQNQAEMLDFFNVAVRLSTAAQMDMEQTSSQLIQIMNMFSIPMANASAAADVLTNAFIQTTAEMSDLMIGMRYVGPYANAAGLSFNATAAALGMLSQAGMSASMAGTSLRNIIQQLLAPTGRWAGVLRSVGGGFQYTNGYMNFGEMLNRMQRAMAQGKISAADVMGLVGRRGAPAFLALIQKGGDAFNRFTEETRKAGTTQAYAERQMEGLSGAFNRFIAAWERFKISLTEGSVGSMLALVLRFFTWLFDILADLPDEVWTFIGAVAALTAVIGPLIYIIGALKVALSALAAHPIILAIMIIIVLISLLYTKLKPLFDEWNRIARITDKAKHSFENLSTPLRIMLVISTLLRGMWDYITQSIEESIMDLQNFGTVVSRLVTLIRAAWNYSQSRDPHDNTASALSSAQEEFTNAVNTLRNAPHNAYMNFTSMMQSVLSGHLYTARIEIQPGNDLNAIIQGVQQHGAGLTPHGLQLVVLPPSGSGGGGVGTAPFFNPNIGQARAALGLF